jgi:hypothetical protein
MIFFELFSSLTITLARNPRGFDSDTVEKFNLVAANFSLRKNMIKHDKEYDNFSPAKAGGYHFSKDVATERSSANDGLNKLSPYIKWTILDFFKNQEIILDKRYSNHYNIILKLDLDIPHITVTFHPPLSSK